MASIALATMVDVVGPGFRARRSSRLGTQAIPARPNQPIVCITSLIAVVFSAPEVSPSPRVRLHDPVTMLNVEHRRPERFCKGRRWLGILAQDVSRDGRQPRVVSALQFLEDKRQGSRRQRAMADPEQQRTPHPRHRRGADAAIDRVALVEQLEKSRGKGTVAASDLDDAEEFGLRANVVR